MTVAGAICKSLTHHILLWQPHTPCRQKPSTCIISPGVTFFYNALPAISHPASLPSIHPHLKRTLETPKTTLIHVPPRSLSLPTGNGESSICWRKNLWLWSTVPFVNSSDIPLSFPPALCVEYTLKELWSLRTILTRVQDGKILQNISYVHTHWI